MSWCWNDWIGCYHLAIHSFLTDHLQARHSYSRPPFTPFANIGLWERPLEIKVCIKHTVIFPTLLLAPLCYYKRPAQQQAGAVAILYTLVYLSPMSVLQPGSLAHTPHQKLRLPWQLTAFFLCKTHQTKS